MPMDASFEQKFGQMVDAQINERLPSLVDFRIGFQCMDKNEDETHAVGVAAFVLNNIWLYIPVFFIEGDLRGFDQPQSRLGQFGWDALPEHVAIVVEAMKGAGQLPHPRRDLVGSPIGARQQHGIR